MSNQTGDRFHTTDDIVIVGAGLAGLFCALKLAPRPVTVISAAPLGEGKFIERCRLIPKPLTNRPPEDYLCSGFNRGGSLAV